MTTFDPVIEKEVLLAVPEKVLDRYQVRSTAMRQEVLLSAMSEALRLAHLNAQREVSHYAVLTPQREGAQHVADVMTTLHGAISGQVPDPAIVKLRARLQDDLVFSAFLGVVSFVTALYFLTAPQAWRPVGLLWAFFLLLACVSGVLIYRRLRRLNGETTNGG